MVARSAHNPEVASSNLVPATIMGVHIAKQVYKRGRINSGSGYWPVAQLDEL